MSQSADDSRPLLVVLLLLTMVSGLVDAVAYLGLGHVFAANMTGNVVVLGFAAARAPGFSAVATLTAIGAFVVGALVAGRFGRRMSSRRHLLLTAMTIEAALVGAATVLAASAHPVGSGWIRFTLITLLALAMGLRNSTVRRLAVPDVVTNVVTGTLTGLAADSSLAGGTNLHAGRRATAVAAMTVGAFVGALLQVHLGATVPLVVITAVVVTATVVAAVSPSIHLLDKTD